MMLHLKCLVQHMGEAAARRTNLAPSIHSPLVDLLAGLEALYAGGGTESGPVEQDVVNLVAHESPNGSDPFGAVGSAFRLDAKDVELLVVAAAGDLDPSISVGYGLLRGMLAHARPTVELALELCAIPTASTAAVRHLASGSPLVRHGLLTITEDDPWLARELSVPERVLGHLLHAEGLDGDLRPLRRQVFPFALPGTDFLAGAVAAGTPLCWVHSPAGSAGLSLAAAALRAVGRAALVIDLSLVPPDGSLSKTMHRALREAGLLGCGLVLASAERLSEPAQRAALSLLAEAVLPVIAVGAEPWDPAWFPHAPMTLVAPVLGIRERNDVWTALGGDPGAGVGLDGLRLTPESIVDIHRHATVSAAASGAVLDADVVRLSARQVTGMPGGRRNRSNPGTLDDLVLPPHVLAALRRFVAWARTRERRPGLAAGLGAGGGISLAALFTGAPGTGKTLAAQIIADELGLDLLTVELTTIVSKYIGDTQKNLERAFLQAENHNVLLFFDEADALFGRRSQVKDSHDRYANQEIAFLLQRLERFDGVVILATNLHGNLDRAFARRMGVIAHFPDPDAVARRRLWEMHVGRAGTAIDPGDPMLLDILASPEMSGGEIRNIVAGASYDAAAEESPLGMRHLRVAMLSELYKLGRRVPTDHLA